MTLTTNKGTEYGPYGEDAGEEEYSLISDQGAVLWFNGMATDLAVTMVDVSMSCTV